MEARSEQRRRLVPALLGVGAAVFVVAGGAYLWSGNPPPPAPDPLPTGVRGACPEGMVQIPGGSFQMGSNDGDPDEKPLHPVTVKTFCLDRTEVTVGAYTACVNEKKCSAEHLNQSSMEGTSFSNSSYCNYGVAEKTHHPMNCVDWAQSETYCKAQNKRLPKEEEWEYAARGGEQQRIYPWGNDVPTNQLCWDGEGSDLGRKKRYSTCEVGKYDKGTTPWGVSDMAGNVWEWTASAYCPYPQNGISNDDCTNARRVLRGGGWDDVNAAYVRAADRLRKVPAYRDAFVGFRCARTP
jgi:formylglycine-generating enzyme